MICLSSFSENQHSEVLDLARKSCRLQLAISGLHNPAPGLNFRGPTKYGYLSQVPCLHNAVIQFFRSKLFSFISIVQYFLFSMFCVFLLVIFVCLIIFFFISVFVNFFLLFPTVYLPISLSSIDFYIYYLHILLFIQLDLFVIASLTPILLDMFLARFFIPLTVSFILSLLSVLPSDFCVKNQLQHLPCLFQVRRRASISSSSISESVNSPVCVWQVSDKGTCNLRRQAFSSIV